MSVKKESQKNDRKKKTLRDLTNFQLLSILERFNVKYSVKLDDEDNSKYTLFVRKENVTDEMHIICLKRLHFGVGKEAYVKELKKGMTPYEYMISESEQFKIDHPDYVSKKERLLETNSSDEVIELDTPDSDEIPF